MSNHDELKALYAKAKVHFETDNNFTICELTFKGNRVFGIAKRNPNCDPMIPERGEQIAYARALRNLDAKYVDHSVSLLSRMIDAVTGA